MGQNSNKLLQEILKGYWYNRFYWGLHLYLDVSAQRDARKHFF